MDFLKYLVWQTWTWTAHNGLAIASLIVLAILIPRIRRFIIAITSNNFAENEEETKGRKALIGAIVYTVEMIVYFVIALALLKKFGISLSAAAIPATVVSAAIGFGAQSVIKDLLGGIFIIAEKQYGIGDWVEFHSPSDTVQGDVVNMTLRATTIRTLNGEEVIVPNSDARMCVNYSSRWSRAVIEVPVPMTAGGSIEDLENRTVAAAKKALNMESVRNSVMSELVLQSSTALNEPPAMGLPWTVTMRLIVDCNPGEQWLIERAIRAAVIDTWWEDYGERASHMPIGEVGAAEKTTGHARDTEMVRRINDEQSGAPLADTPTTELANSNEDAPTAVEKGFTASHDRGRSDIPSTGSKLDDIHRAHEDNAQMSDEDRAVKTAAAKSGDAWSQMPIRQRIRTVMSAGGRARVSTVVLLCLLFVLCLLNVSTLEWKDGPSGWLAPSRFEHTSTTESATSTPESSAVSTTPPRKEPAETTQPDSTRTQQPKQANTEKATTNDGTSNNTGNGAANNSTGRNDVNSGGSANERPNVNNQPSAEPTSAPGSGGAQHQSGGSAADANTNTGGTQ